MRPRAIASLTPSQPWTKYARTFKLYNRKVYVGLREMQTKIYTSLVTELLVISVYLFGFALQVTHAHRFFIILYNQGIHNPHKHINAHKHTSSYTNHLCDTSITQDKFNKIILICNFKLICIQPTPLGPVE